jgi:2-(1,2-epoxy-1,2-dihydrophenyl)acetyl-CoA isomerase
MGETILAEKKGHVCILTMNRPNKLNTLNEEMINDLSVLLEQCEADNEVRCVVLTGSGRAFCAGADIEYVTGKQLDSIGKSVDFMYPLQNVLIQLYRFPKPIIAAANGHCVGAGFSLALACDYIIASEDAKFSQIFGQLGLAPDLGSLYFLPRIVGPSKAKDLIFTADLINSQEAHELGIVTKVIRNEELIETAFKRAEQVAQMAPRALRLSKQTLNETFELSLDTLLEKEALIQGVLLQTKDFHEGVHAFKEKRKPSFTGE